MSAHLFQLQVLCERISSPEEKLQVHYKEVSDEESTMSSVLGHLVRKAQELSDDEQVIT